MSNVYINTAMLKWLHPGLNCTVRFAVCYASRLFGKETLLYTGSNYARCSYDTKTVVAFKPPSSNGIRCISFVAFSKVSTLDCVFSCLDVFWCTFSPFSCTFSLFSCERNVYLQRNSCFSRKCFCVNGVALVADDLCGAEMKLVVRWTGILRTLNWNFLVPVVFRPAIMTDLKRNGRPTLLYDRILADGQSLFSSLHWQSPSGSSHFIDLSCESAHAKHISNNNFEGKFLSAVNFVVRLPDKY